MNIRILPFVILIALAAIGCDSIGGPSDDSVFETRIHVRPAWSPDGSTIVYHNARLDSLGLYLVDTSGTDLGPLVLGDAIGASWSPDSQWIAYSKQGTIYKIRVNGEEETALTLTTAGSIRPAWSQDGLRIAFVSNTVGSTFVLNLQTNEEVSMEYPGDFPSWHPSDTLLVVLEALVNPGSGGVYTFWLLDPDTRVPEEEPLHFFSSPEDVAFSSINSAGTEIIYGAKPPTGYTQVWKIDLSTNQHIQLTDDGGDYPAWSPDGSKIVYTRTVEGDGGLWIMNADGSGKRRLTTP